jgi:hypothetical protein
MVGDMQKKAWEGSLRGIVTRDYSLVHGLQAEDGQPM